VLSVERTLATRYSTYFDEVTRLIRAAVTVMEQQQTTNPKVLDIVREAGVSNQAFYRHFRGKGELLLAVLDDGQRQLIEYLQHQMAKGDTGLAKIRSWVEGIMSQAVAATAASATRGVMLNSLSLQVEYPEEWRRLSQQLFNSLVGAVELAQDQGDISVTDLTMATWLVIRAVRSTMERCVLDRQAPSPAQIESVVDFVLNGLGASSDRPEPSKPKTARRPKSQGSKPQPSETIR
jgi:AcrR family transcriptional regulator